jgi:hypothetical protein
MQHAINTELYLTSTREICQRHRSQRLSTHQGMVYETKQVQMKVLYNKTHTFLAGDSQFFKNSTSFSCTVR